MILCCTLCFSACAEKLGSDFSSDEIELTIPEFELPDVSLLEKSRAATSTDTVNNNDGVYTIISPSGLYIKFDSRGTTFMTLTQSYYGSYDVYSLFNSSSEADKYINNLISQNIHIVVWDRNDNFQAIALNSLGSDDLTKHVQNLASLSEKDINYVASSMAQAVGVDSYDLYSFNGNIWVMLGSVDLFTIANSEYVHVVYAPNGSSMTKNDYSYYTDFMRSLALW